MTRSKAGWLFLGLVFVLALAGFTPAVYAHGGDSTLVHACVNKSSGEVKIVGVNASCKNNETAVDWPRTSAALGQGSIMVHGVGAGVGPPLGQPAVVFVGFGGGVNEYRLPRNGTIQNMRILVTENSYDGVAIVTLMVNGTATLLTATIPAGSTADIDVAGSVGVVDGDRISVVLDRSAPTAGLIRLSVSYEIQ